MIETFLTHRNDQLRNACKEAIRNGTHPIVRGTLYLPHSQIQSLPEGLKVCGDLDLAYSQIRTLPDDLWVGGDLNLSYSQINELPSNLEAGGGLFLWDTPIASLPNGLKVGGSLYLNRIISFGSLPADLKVGRRVFR